MPRTDKTKKTPWRIVGWTVGGWLGGHLSLISGHVLVIYLYSVLLAPGRPEAHYSDFAQASGPWFSILVGGPVFYGLGRLLHWTLGSQARSVGLRIWVLYSLTDLSILLAFVGVPSPLLAGQWVVSQAVKLAALRIATPAMIIEFIHEDRL